VEDADEAVGQLAQGGVMALAAVTCAVLSRAALAGSGAFARESRWQPVRLWYKIAFTISRISYPPW
jgi:ABC-type arginine transport system permease subunit